MKKILLLSVLVLLLISCERKSGRVSQSDDDRINRMLSPVVVVAKSDWETRAKERNSLYFQLDVTASITVKDGNGKFVTFDGSKGLGASLYCTYNVRDTIR